MTVERLLEIKCRELVNKLGMDGEMGMNPYDRCVVFRVEPVNPALFIYIGRLFIVQPQIRTCDTVLRLVNQPLVLSTSE